MFRSIVLFTFLFSKRNKAAGSLRTFCSPMSLDVYATIFFPSEVKFDLLYSNADLDIFLSAMLSRRSHRSPFRHLLICMLACENYSVDNILSRTLHGNVF